MIAGVEISTNVRFYASCITIATLPPWFTPVETFASRFYPIVHGNRKFSSTLNFIKCILARLAQ